MDILLFGIQGSGKGTQAQLLSEKFGFSIFETGAELRKIRSEDSGLGSAIREIIDRGDLVPNAIVMDIVAHFLEGISAETPILFDGIPRSLKQKESLDALLSSRDRTVHGIFLSVPRDEAIVRMLERGREDDTRMVIERRLQNYEMETLPVIESYEAEGKLTRVEGINAVDRVFADCSLVIEKTR